ncbi:SPOR domain-containing protein [uncultured Polaribacter sp.]|uniref:SPOR domain-containing protein n=1 Tax=uncultured Polaribacter sp. TaxID=174711 RepID=UPI00260B5F90|nr:SPOR domain-containing protein [uncultured Polaribacter sp.]
MKNILFIGAFLGAITITNAQNKTKISDNVIHLLKKKKAYNKADNFGFTVQIYNGYERTAKSKRAKFQMLYPNVKTKLVYNEPDWKVQVGNYKSRLEADRAMLLFKKEFSGIIVVPKGNKTF